jgi:hypothetical protein
MPNPLTLLDAFARVPDPRRPHGRFHPLVAVLARTTVAMLAGCNSLSALAPFGRDRGRPLAVALGFRRAKTPNPSALGKLFRRLDIAAFENALAVWRASRGWTGEHAALDGKTLTGSLPGGLPGQPLWSGFIPEKAAVRGPLPVAPTTNEHPAALRRRGVLPRTGRMITADARFTPRDVGDTITHSGGDDVPAADDHPPGRKQDIEDAVSASADFSPRPPAVAAGGRATRPIGQQGPRPAGEPLDPNDLLLEPIP